MAKLCYLSKMSGEGNRFFSFFLFFNIFFLTACAICQCACECQFILTKVRKKNNNHRFSEHWTDFGGDILVEENLQKQN